jgi:hypothetical protein
VQLGLVAGLVASIVMALVIMGMTAAGIMSAPWFLLLGTLFGGSGIPYYIGTYGFVWHLGLGIFWGLVFVLGFHTLRSYSVTKGLALGGLQLLLIAIALTFVATPELGGTILTAPMVVTVILLIELALAYATYGVVVGYIAKKFKRIHYATG